MKKKLVISILLILTIVLCSCSKSVNNSKENDSETNIKSTTDEDLQNCSFADFKVLPNGDYIKFYKNNDIYQYIQIFDAKSNQLKVTKDISACEISNLIYRNLNDYFYICSNNIYVYDFSGNLIKTINYPADIQNRFGNRELFALSNDLSKIIYCSENETEEEIIIELKLLDLNSNSEKIIHNLNSLDLNKPCEYNSLSFSKDDNLVIFKGQKYIKENDAKQCYGNIDLTTFKISSEFISKSYCKYNGNTQIIYDVNVNYGETSSGKITIYNPNDGIKHTVNLKNKNESQHISISDKENTFITMLPNEKDYTVTVTVYENEKVIKKGKIIVENEEDFNLLNLDDFCYSTISNCVYYSYGIINNNNFVGEKFCILEMK